MRNLNKIVLINSTNINYEEFPIDGNVHFIGTQGVGKSSVLRAIDFFYSADKKNGKGQIQGQRSFDDFYLPGLDSYIVYEIKRENGYSFILMFRHKGRAAFRIVDCKFEKRFIMKSDGPEKCEAETEWSKISHNIGVEVYKSNIIQSYKDYLDIIYGNAKEVDNKLRRFNILSSSRYQHIPQTIHNIFLNQGLDSQVIKNIIIDSMNVDDTININEIRHLTENFRKQYDDIDKWFRKEKDGTITVKEKADKVCSLYSNFQICRERVKKLTAYVLYALNRDRKELPVLENKINTIKKELADDDKKMIQEESSYSMDRDALNQHIGKMRSILEDTEKKRKYYKDINIDVIIDKMNHEEEIKTLLSHLVEQLSQMTEQCKDIKSKYDNLLQGELNNKKQLELDVKERKSKLESEERNELTVIEEEFNKNWDKISNNYSSKLKELRKNNQLIQDSLSNCLLESERIKHANPYSKQMNEEKSRINKLNARMNELQEKSDKLKNDIEDILHEERIKQKDIEYKTNENINEIEHEKKSVQNSIIDLENLLNRQKGSFLEWLDENKEGWQETIGKIVDEKAVLYNTDLNPMIMQENNESFFGIHISVENINKTVKTPQNIRENIVVLKKQYNKLQNDIKYLRDKSLKDIKQLETSTINRLKSLRDNKRALDENLSDIPVRINTSKTLLAEYDEQLKAFRKKEQEKNSQLLNEITRKKIENENESIQIESDFDNSKKSLQSTLNNNRNQIITKYSYLKSNIEQELKKINQDSEERVNKINALMNSEFQGHSVDVDNLNQLKKQIKDCENELKFINESRNKYNLYLRDRDDLFNHEKENRDDIESSLKALKNLNIKFERTKKAISEDIKNHQSNLNGATQEEKEIREAIAETEEVMHSSSWPSNFAISPEETNCSLSKILKELQNKRLDYGSVERLFKNAVRNFIICFSSQNIFNFRTTFNNDQEYEDFAENLIQFIDNNLIDTYRKEVNTKYIGILRTISLKVAILLKAKSSIESVVKNINKGFGDSNFVGAIKSIQLQVSESNDPLIRHLLKIKNFDDVHSNDIGEVDLFTTNESARIQNNLEAQRLLSSLLDFFEEDIKRDSISLADIFRLEFRVVENDNDTGWTERLSNVGSDGTDILTKAMINIMLIDFFKKEATKRTKEEFWIHCMMDEIGKLHPTNVEGILHFANERNIYLINSSPTTYNAKSYKYTYELSKDSNNKTIKHTLMEVEDIEN